MPEIKNNGLIIYYEIHGSGQPVLLIAGLGSDSASWGSIIQGFSYHFKTIIFDNRGCGRSNSPSDQYSIDEMADDAINLLNTLKIKQAHILGHSMGGYIAQKIAALHPDRVSKLILASTAARPSERNNRIFSDLYKQFESGIDYEAWIRNWIPWLFSKKTIQNKQFIDAFVKGAVTYPYRQGTNGFKGQVQAIASFDGRGLIKNIKAETLVLEGEDDRLITPQEARQLADEIDGSVFRLLKDTGHSIFVENPSALNEEVFNFLK